MAEEKRDHVTHLSVEILSFGAQIYETTQFWNGSESTNYLQVYSDHCCKPTRVHAAILLLTKSLLRFVDITVSAMNFLKYGRKRNAGNMSSAMEWLVILPWVSDISCRKSGSEWSKRWPNSMLMMTFATHDVISCFTSRGRPCCSRSLFIISSTSTKILVSITRRPKPNRFKMDKHSLWLLLNSAS